MENTLSYLRSDLQAFFLSLGKTLTPPTPLNLRGENIELQTSQLARYHCPLNFAGALSYF